MTLEQLWRLSSLNWLLAMFDCFAAVDWSARSTPSPAKPVADAIYTCVGARSGIGEPRYFRTRHAAFDALCHLFEERLRKGKRLIIGFDLSLGYPTRFAQAVTGTAHAFALWQEITNRIEDDDQNRNNRFDVANDINGTYFGKGPFWGCPATRSFPYLPAKASARDAVPFAELRQTETLTTGAQPCWKLFTTGSVGSQILLGLPYLEKLRQSFAPHVAVWPFDPIDHARIVMVECYFRLVPILHPASTPIMDILDARQVYSFVHALAGLSQAQWSELFNAAPQTPQILEEGWTFGAGVWQVQPQQGRAAK